MSRTVCIPELLNLPYFYTNFRSSEQVKEFLNRQRVGSFILRPSFSKPNCVSVSVVLATGDIRHLNIHLDSTREVCLYFLVPESKFPSIQELVEHYRINPVHNEEQVTDVRFLFPVVRPTRLQHRRDTDPALGTTRYESLLRSNSIQNGSNGPRANGSVLNRSGSDFGLPRPHQQDGGSPQRVLSTRSEGNLQRNRGREGGLRSRSLTDSVRRSPHDKLPTVPAGSSQNVLGRRPPAALPNGGTAEFNGEYSSPRPADVDMSHQLAETLREIEISGVCDCGLPTKESQLPEGWSIHQTPATPNVTRRLFYQSPEGRTFWVLPEPVATQLTEEHKENIRMLEELCRTAPPIAEEG